MADIPSGRSQAQIASFRGHDPALPERPTAPHPPAPRLPGEVSATGRLALRGSLSRQRVAVPGARATRSVATAESGAGLWAEAWLWTPGPGVQAQPRASLSAALARCPPRPHRARLALGTLRVSLWERHQNSRRKDKTWKQPGGGSSPGSGPLRPGAAEALSQRPGSRAAAGAARGPLGVRLSAPHSAGQRPRPPTSRWALGPASPP